MLSLLTEREQLVIVKHRGCFHLDLCIRPLLCFMALVSGMTRAAPGKEDGMTIISNVEWPGLCRAEGRLLWE